MYAIRGIYDGQAIVPLERIAVRPNVEVIITFLDDAFSPLGAEDETAGLLALSGTWEDDRTVEDIIKDIYDSRTISREDLML